MIFILWLIQTQKKVLIQVTTRRPYKKAQKHVVERRGTPITAVETENGVEEDGDKVDEDVHVEANQNTCQGIQLLCRLSYAETLEGI